MTPRAGSPRPFQDVTNYLCHLMRSSKVNIYAIDEEAFCTMNSFEYGRMALLNEFTSKLLGYDELVHQLAKPAVRSVLYAWASLGLLEIACTPSLTKDAVSPFDSLQYVTVYRTGQIRTGQGENLLSTESAGCPDTL